MTNHNCGFERTGYQQYDPDLEPSDVYLFPNLKKHLDVTRFTSDVAVIAAAMLDDDDELMLNVLRCQLTY